jgi:hypothetical protein
VNLDKRVGFRSSNATCYPAGSALAVQVGEPAQRSGSPTYKYHKCLTEHDISPKRYANRELARKNLGDRTLPIADLQIAIFIFINHGERGSRTVNVLPSPG